MNIQTPTDLIAEPPVDQIGNDSQCPAEDRRFSDPAIAEIVELWRQRQDFHRAEKRLTLQTKAILRRFCDGDKAEAEKLHKLVVAGVGPTEAQMAVFPLISAKKTVEDHRTQIEKTLRKLAKALPIYEAFVKDVRGFGELGLAATVGEIGDLSAYKSVSAVWKRAGLAVIEGGRQRRVAGDAAILHGYAPERRSVFWTLADSMLKAQGKDEKAGPYRRIYDERKAYERPRVASDAHAHNRAMRVMFKQLLRDLAVAWKALPGHGATDTHVTTAGEGN